MVSFRNIEKDLVFKLLDVGWEHSRSNKVLWGIGPAFWLENWGWMRRSWFWTGYCTFICKVQRGKRQCSAISIGQNILSLTSTPSMNYFELKRHWRGCDSTEVISTLGTGGHTKTVFSRLNWNHLLFVTLTHHGICWSLKCTKMDLPGVRTKPG